MQLMLDHISSILIASAVILVVLSTQFQAQRAATEQTIAYASKKMTLDLASMLEQELALIGDGTTDTITDVQTNADGQTTVFEFWREDELGTDIEITYRLTTSDIVDIDGESVQLYRMDRYEDDVLSGGGGERLRHFSLTMLDESGGVTADAASARLIRAVVVNAFPYGTSADSYLFESHWGITIRPMNLDD